MRFNFKNRKIEIQTKEMKGLNKILGLMIYRKKALLFSFKKPVKIAIHSYFCPDFLAIWLAGNKLVDYKIINKPKFSIKPKKAFDKLLEIPLNKKYSSVIKIFEDKTLK